MCILVADKVRSIAYTNANEFPSYHAHQHIGLVIVTLQLVAHSMLSVVVFSVIFKLALLLSTILVTFCVCNVVSKVFVIVLKQLLFCRRFSILFARSCHDLSE